MRKPSQSPSSFGKNCLRTLVLAASIPVLNNCVHQTKQEITKILAADLEKIDPDSCIPENLPKIKTKKELFNYLVDSLVSNDLKEDEINLILEKSNDCFKKKRQAEKKLKEENQPKNLTIEKAQLPVQSEQQKLKNMLIDPQVEASDPVLEKSEPSLIEETIPNNSSIQEKPIEFNNDDLIAQKYEIYQRIYSKQIEKSIIDSVKEEYKQLGESIIFKQHPFLPNVRQATFLAGDWVLGTISTAVKIKSDTEAESNGSGRTEIQLVASFDFYPNQVQFNLHFIAVEYFQADISEFKDEAAKNIHAAINIAMRDSTDSNSLSKKGTKEREYELLSYQARASWDCFLEVDKIIIGSGLSPNELDVDVFKEALKKLATEVLESNLDIKNNHELLKKLLIVIYGIHIININYEPDRKIETSMYLDAEDIQEQIKNKYKNDLDFLNKILENTPPKKLINFN